MRNFIGNEHEKIDNVITMNNLENMEKLTDI